MVGVGLLLPRKKRGRIVSVWGWISRSKAWGIDGSAPGGARLGMGWVLGARAGVLGFRVDGVVGGDRAGGGGWR
ncbi:unnamed protein product [Prunus armeniaca]|uniref:Uncharacterized protein n=1 Tax=Prunus armeniaca TaxID=36596 RepID=A0A6J5TX50_PRUAR|nr:unnamed protein product [Prunus armeniaca]CAB4298714.1 unnamed protein product [Prunus armeniaca]